LKATHSGEDVKMSWLGRKARRNTKQWTATSKTRARTARAQWRNQQSWHAVTCPI